MGRERLQEVAGVIAAGFIVGVASTYMAIRFNEKDMAEKLVEAYDIGYKNALNVDKPSMDLEMSCVALWADKQGVMKYNK
jgi:hypothetical protein